MKKNILLTILFLIVLTACNPGANNRHDPVLQQITINGYAVTAINLKAIPDEVTKIGLSEFFAELEVIPLDSATEALITNSTIYFADDFFLLGTQTTGGSAHLLRFDYEGNYLNTIGSEGRGPGEHFGYLITTLKYNPILNTVLVSWGSFENQLFRPDGTFLSTIQVPVELMSNISILVKDKYFSYGSTTSRPRMLNDSVKVVFYKSDGTITKIIKRTNYPPENTTAYTPFGNASLFTYNDEKKIYFPGDHTIYRVENHNLMPVAVIRHDENILPFNKLTTPEEIIGSYQLEILAETERNWFIKKSIYTEANFREFENEPGQWGGSFDTKERLIVIDKKTNKGKIYSFTDDLLYIFPDKFVNKSLPWQGWQKGFGAYMTVSPGGFLNAQKVSEQLDKRSPEVVRKLEVLDGISANDNHILFIFRFQEAVEINSFSES